MNRSSLRVQLCQSYRWMLGGISNECDEDDLRRAAIVFSPHFDDETLGCGGTIIKKKKAGADVKIVFMTDGSKSHTDLISQDELKAIRASEGLAATRSLGLETSDIFFLGFEETKLSEHMDSATGKVVDMLLLQQPGEVFIPFRKEPSLWSLDHLVTNRIVRSALQTYGRNIVTYEYPIWFWYNWPWASPPIRSAQEFLKSSKNSLVSGFRLLKEFRSLVYVGDVLGLKRIALDQYKSQMTRLIPDPRWKTLNDISNGQFLECFFQEYEIFRRSTS